MSSKNLYLAMQDIRKLSLAEISPVAKNHPSRDAAVAIHAAAVLLIKQACGLCSP